jgi:methyl-accepting chemotaxis protein
MRWTIRKRLVSLSALGLLLLLAVAVTGGWSLRRASRTSRTMQQCVLAVREQMQLNLVNAAIRSDVLALVAARTAAERDQGATALEQHARELDRFFEQAVNRSLDPQTIALLRDAREGSRRAAALALELARRERQGETAAAERLLPSLHTEWEQLEPVAAGVSDRLGSLTTAAGRDLDEAAAAGGTLIVVIASIALLALLFAAHAVRQSIVEPLDAASSVMDAIAGGDLDARVATTRDDELGRLGGDVNRAVESLSAALARIADSSVAVGNASEELASVSNQLQASAVETSEQMGVATRASKETNTSVRLVAASAQQVGAGIRNVAQNAQEAAAVAATAVRVAAEANAAIRQLGESSEQIDNVIRVINAIAEQTNILALNAEIEAARAGDAGRGFAVVANEVKELAKETARATDDIARRVNAIRDDSRGAVTGIAEIGRIIEQISTTQSAIAASVQEQSAATAEITRNMGEAARGTDEIAATVGQVARSTENTTIAARETQRAASELAMMATELQRTVSQFRFGERSTAASGTSRGPTRERSARRTAGRVVGSVPRAGFSRRPEPADDASAEEAA